MLEHVRGVMAYNCLSNTIKGTSAIDHPVITARHSKPFCHLILGNVRTVIQRNFCIVYDRLCRKRRAKQGLKETNRNTVGNHDLFRDN